MWKITKNPIDGYKFASADWNVKEARKISLFEFRMLAPANEELSLYIYGVSTVPDSLDPLLDFGIAAGCDYIEYKDKNGIFKEI